MAEKSIFWTTGATGDGATSYTQSEVIRWMRQLWLGDNTDEGVMKNYLNELSASGAVSPVAVNTGAAVVYGFPYWNTSSVNVAIPTPAGSTRIDLIVLRADWTAQTTRITRIAGTEGAGPPALTQTDGVLWDVPLWQASITTGGAITLTDTRVYVHPNIEIETQMLVDGFDGDGIKIAAGALDIEPADFAGAGLEDDGADNLRIASAAAGDGLKGGSGAALDIEPADFAGTGLEDDGADNLRIASAAAGDGLTGGSGSALATDPDGTTLENSGGKIQVKAEGIGPTQITNRTRKIFIPCIGGWNNTDSLELTMNAAGVIRGFPLLDNKFSYATGTFYCPSDFLSGATATAIILADASGNLYGRNEIYYAADGQAPNTHQVNPAVAAVAVNTNNNEVFQESLASLAAGDIIRLAFERQADNALDTVNAACYIAGWIFEYTADS